MESSRLRDPLNRSTCKIERGPAGSKLTEPNSGIFLFFRKSDSMVVTAMDIIIDSKIFSRRVWRYQRGNHNPYIEEQTTQLSKEKGQKDKQRSTKHTHRTKDRVTRTY